jgi:hypothetical protein
MQRQQCLLLLPCSQPPLVSTKRHIIVHLLPQPPLQPGALIWVQAMQISLCIIFCLLLRRPSPPPFSLVPLSGLPTTDAVFFFHSASEL